MSKKKLNYILFKNVLHNTRNDDKLFLIAHYHDNNSIENSVIESLCKENNINFFRLKLSYLNKLFKNKIKFLNLFKGPTVIFSFKDFNSFLIFSKDAYVKKSVIPLTFYINNNFYSYKKIVKLATSTLNKKKKYMIKNMFLVNMKNSHNKLLLLLNKIIESKN